MYDWTKTLSHNLTFHPLNNGMTYREHWLRAFFIGIDTLFLSIIFVIHAFFPFAFVDTGSDGIKKLAAHFKEKDEQSEDKGLQDTQ
ncbi:MAG: DUF6356 family protein [Woeseiaceae bacterium]